MFIKPTTGGSSWSANGWDSSQFEPVLWPSRLNQGCVLNNPANCPFIFRLLNDPTVVRTNNPSYPYVMYFTGAVQDTHQGSWFGANYTHMAVSTDGLNWGNVSILKKGQGYFPAGLPYNQANGSARAQFDTQSGMIILITVATPDHPVVEGSPDAWKTFIHVIDPADPSRVVSTRVLSKDNYQARVCTPGQVCAVAQPL